MTDSTITREKKVYSRFSNCDSWDITIYNEKDEIDLQFQTFKYDDGRTTSTVSGKEELDAMVGVLY